MAGVARKLQACCKPVVSLLEASTCSPSPDPRAEHWSRPGRERRRVPQNPGIWYRLRKGCRGYRDLSDCRLACTTDAGLARSHDSGAHEMRPTQEPRKELAGKPSGKKPTLKQRSPAHWSGSCSHFNVAGKSPRSRNWFRRNASRSGK